MSGAKLRQIGIYCPKLDQEILIDGPLLHFDRAVQYGDSTIRSVTICFRCDCGEYHEMEVQN